MSNRRPSSPSSHVFTRRHVLGAGLSAALAAGAAAAWPGLAQAAAIDPDAPGGVAPDRIRAQGDPDFHPVKFRLPAPTGRKALGTTAVHLIDRSRPDPAMPSGQRELMISLWYPAGMFGSAPFAKYMPPRTAVEVDDAWTGEYGLALPSGSFDFAGTVTHARIDVPAQPMRHPVVLFSPGFQYSRFVNTAQVEDLASRGYVVVTIDHSHETPVEFPGGRFLPGAPESEPPGPDQIRAAVETRTADARFVLDQLERMAGGRKVDAEGKDLPKDLADGLDLRKVGMFGIGLGGYATANTMLEDERIAAGIDLDGTLQDDRKKGPLGDVAKSGLDRPFLLFGSGETQRTDPAEDNYDASWASFWKTQHGGKLNLALANTKQKAFTDYQFIFSQLFHDIYGEDPIITSVMKALVGSAKPARSVLAQREYIAAFFDQTLRRRPALLLRGDSPKFPEIRFVR
ncbi:alpha/beta hydrolase [Kribbella jiaozuonensis]|uniref:Lipase n=1 Tax=Kribbella jiaozuonensis TaxID=2575441 RepID=A0A4U3M2N4_9ACTN|nr:lipase [Kribbella jiaozuonensis]TKK81487.1 lipase [Kribbella jiaozuonensis]